MSGDLDHERVADAGEYVLGTLSAAERARLESAMAGDPELRTLVGWYRETLIGLDPADAAPVPDALWQRIEDAIRPAPGGPAEAAGPAVVDLASWRRRVARWRMTAVTATAASLLFATLLIADQLRAVPEPGLLPLQRFVVMVDAGGQAQYLLEARADGRVLARPVGRPSAPDGRSLELWSIGADAVPRSLGLLPVGQGRVLSVEPAGIARASFAVSLEPRGGSPTGAPTGPVVLTQR